MFFEAVGFGGHPPLFLFTYSFFSQRKKYALSSGHGLFVFSLMRAGRMDTLKGKERYSMVDHIQSAEDLESLFWHIVFDDDFGKNNPEFTTELYHYTDKETMVTCILHDKEDNDDKKDDKLYKANRLDLRLTNLTKFSDKEEGCHILPVLKCSLEESYRAKEIDHAFFDQMTCEIDSYVQKNNDLSDWYVFCFSRNGDCQYLKKNYACQDKKLVRCWGFKPWNYWKRHVAINLKKVRKQRKILQLIIFLRYCFAM